MPEGKNPSFQRWDLSHDPEARPLGCNGKYGASGRLRHTRRKEKVCKACSRSLNHYQRELRRGQNIPRKALDPCGTRGAARRHREKNEPIDLPCRLAEAAQAAARRKPVQKIA